MKSNLVTNNIQYSLFDEPNLFVNEKQGDLAVQSLNMPNAEVCFYPGFFTREESSNFFTSLTNEIKWRQDKIKLYGKEMDLPRKTAWYADEGKSYKFSGIYLAPEPWTSALLQIKQRLENTAKAIFNSVMLNLYRDGNDGISWHSDAEPEFGKNPTIASVSFGAARRFMFKHKYDKNLKSEVELTNGSLLLMSGETQHFWQHQIPKTSKKLEPRINLTFREVITR